MTIKVEQLWDAIEYLYDEGGSAGKIQPAVAGLPKLTHHGQKCYVILNRGMSR